jgi:hypothetical protein
VDKVDKSASSQLVDWVATPVRVSSALRVRVVQVVASGRRVQTDRPPECPAVPAVPPAHQLQVQLLLSDFLLKKKRRIHINVLEISKFLATRGIRRMF